MKKRIIDFIPFVLVSFLGLSIGLINRKTINENNNVQSNYNTLSMMLETDYNSNNYVPSTSNEWPTSGYIFNEELSKCEYGSKLTWDDTTNEVLMTGNSSDKCYAYFDKYQSITINSSSAEAHGTSIVITIDATAGTSDIDSYYYSIDNGENYIKDTSSTHTFSNLDTGTYNVKYYVKDTNGIKSEILSKEVSIVSITLANYVKSLYTGTQGDNNLYYHDSTLENGAGDNSYRYAGAHDEVNNFVCFGSDDETCPDDNLYRIIGVFGDQVKLIKWDYVTSDLLGTDGDYKTRCSSETNCNDGTSKGLNAKSSIGAYYWNYTNRSATYSATNYYNVWGYSKLNTINLNTNYTNNIGSTWSNKIADATWKVGGTTYNRDIVPATAYTNEYTNPDTTIESTYTAKVGLMYISDYGFAASSSTWTMALYNYDSSSVTSVNWMYMGLEEWTVVRVSDTTYSMFYVADTGAVCSFAIVTFNGTVPVVDTGACVRPVFYLNSDVIKVGNNIGSKTDPYRIS